MPTGTRLSHEDAVNRLRAKGISLLSEFKGTQKPILVRCEKHGDEYWIRAHGLVCDVKRMRCCQREEVRERMTGRVVSDETRARISAWQQNGKAPWSGKSFSDGHKEKIRASVHVAYSTIDPHIALAKIGRTAGKRGWFYIAKMDNGLLKFGSTRFDDYEKMRFRHFERAFGASSEELLMRVLVDDAGAYEAAMMQKHRDHWSHGEFFKDFRSELSCAA